MRRILGVVLAVVFYATSAFAQGSIDAEKVYLWTSSTQRMSISTGNGVPTGGVTGDMYIDYTTGDVYTKHSGTWTKVPRFEDAGTWTAAQAFNAGWTGTTGSLSSTLHVGGNFDVATSKFTVAAASGNTVVAGTLGVTGTETISADIVPSVNYVSNVGALTTKFLTVHAAELWVETLVAQNTMATIGGRIMVGTTNTLTTDLTNVATSIVVKYNNLTNGDRIVALANGDIEWFAVTSSATGTGPYTYTVTRNLDGSGANSWPAGTALFDTGTTGAGFVDVFSTGDIRGVVSGPSIVGQVRTGTTYSNIEPRWAIGNLNGAYGYSSTIYGVAMGDPSNSNVTIEATNGLRIRNSTTVYAQLAAGTFTIGNPSGNRLAWDNTTLTVVSANVTLNASGLTLGDSSSFSAYTTASALKFTRPTSGLYGLTGDRYGVYTIANGSVEELYLDNTIKGTAAGSGGSNGGAFTYLNAQGYNATTNTNTTAAQMRLRSQIGNSDISFTAGDFVSSSAAEVTADVTTDYKISVSSTEAVKVSSTGRVDIGNGAPISISGDFITVFRNASSSGHGVAIFGANDSSHHALEVVNYNATTVLFDVLGDGSVLVGNPTGGAKGAGTINVSGGVYLNGVAFTNPEPALADLGARIAALEQGTVYIVALEDRIRALEQTVAQLSGGRQ